jgi:hypothetical protein
MARTVDNLRHWASIVFNPESRPKIGPVNTRIHPPNKNGLSAGADESISGPTGLPVLVWRNCVIDLISRLLRWWAQFQRHGNLSFRICHNSLMHQCHRSPSKKCRAYGRCLLRLTSEV